MVVDITAMVIDELYILYSEMDKFYPSDEPGDFTGASYDEEWGGR